MTDVGTVSGVRYGFQTAPWDAPLALGRHAVIEYNGLIINDRYKADRIKVKSLTGLDGADVRDSREPRPGDHGEFVYDAFYGGRTFVMTGTVEAGSLGGLMRMTTDLEAAFAPLVESPMKLRWFDVTDTFDDPATVSPYTDCNYTALIGSLADVAVFSGMLGWTSATTTALLRSSEHRMYGDSQQTVRIVVGNTDVDTSVSLLPKAMDANNYVTCTFEQASGTPAIAILSVVGGVRTSLNTMPVPSPVIGQSIWLRGKIEGDLLTVELWTAPPTDTTLPSYSIIAWLTGADADMFGDGVLSQVGFAATQADTTWCLDDYHVRSLYPGDVAFNVRKLSQLSMKDSQDGMEFRRDFQIVLRAGEFRAAGATQTRSLTLVPSSGSVPVRGRTYSRTYPRRYTTFLPSTIALESNVLSMCNRGTVFMRPIIVLFGAGSEVNIFNLTNGQQMVWDGTVADGDYLVFDCDQKKVTNSVSAPQMEPFVATSDWLQLEPGWNDLFLSVQAQSANTRMLVFSHHGWN